MSGQYEVMDFLRAQFDRVHSKLDNLASGQLDLSRRVTSLEAQIGRVHGDFANQSLRLDRTDVRLERIERRLDIVTA